MKQMKLKIPVEFSISFASLQPLLYRVECTKASLDSGPKFFLGNKTVSYSGFEDIIYKHKYIPLPAGKEKK